ncbi:PPE domain-containing protein, partial [Saccharomonospora iraqiensis]|uniref:PPE domain-containing protein n=1 Tax=Saccharomonospora iraqiensis TaxID=52698 RepID=UPI00055743AF
MPLPFLIAGAGALAGYSAATQEEAGNFAAGDGSRTIDPHQIYQQLTSGPGTGSLENGREAAGKLKQTFDERVRQMDDLASKMDQAWQGDSGEAAKVGARPLKDWLLDSGYKLESSDRTMGAQADAFNGAVSRVQQVPQKPPESGWLNDINPLTTDKDREIAEYNAKAQANVDAFNAYYEATTTNSRSVPRYSTLTGEFGDIKVDENAGEGGPDAGSGSGTGPAPAGMPGGTSGSGSGSAGSGGFSAPGGGSYAPAASGGAGSVSGSGGYTSGGTDGFTHRPGQWDDGTSASGWAPPKTNVPDLDGSGGGFGPGGGSGIGGPGSGLGGSGGAAGGGAGAAGAVGAVGGYGA